MKVQKNKKLPFVPPITMDIDDTSDLPYKVSDPLPKKSFGMLIIGQPGSGKSTLLCSMLLSKPTKKKKNIPLFYNSYFDHIYLISPSKHTLPLDQLNFNDDRMYDSYSDQHLAEIISKEKDDDNLNNLILLDDCVRDLKNTTDLCRCVLNRRHITQNNDKEGKAGLSIIITAQKYRGGVPLYVRLNMSDVMIFRSENGSELKSIKDELLGDLNKDEQNTLLDTAWENPHDFLYIKTTKPKKDRYYKNFDKIVFED
tara:strand:- start:1093 stop:1857 length:765 start_codon:yes stop_codon:yes gene_type:complete